MLLIVYRYRLIKVNERLLVFFKFCPQTFQKRRFSPRFCTIGGKLFFDSPKFRGAQSLSCLPLLDRDAAGPPV